MLLFFDGEMFYENDKGSGSVRRSNKLSVNNSKYTGLATIWQSQHQ